MNYIGETIKLLQSDEFLNGSKNIEIAKGKHQLVYRIKDIQRKFKRIFYYRSDD